MNPASSLIIFTVFSGLGFGTFFWLGCGYFVSGSQSLMAFLLAFSFSLSGLISSAFHLGNPQRALLAFTQWRSSWLSREAILAVLALILNFFYAFLIVFFDYYSTILGIFSAFFALITVFATAMIYTQMKTVPRWNMPVTPLMFLLYSITGGSIITSIFSRDLLIFNSLSLLLTACFQIYSWRKGDTKYRMKTDIGSATGLSYIGLVRLLEPPHTGSNYLLHEMVYIVAQKHSHKLRWITLVLCFLTPSLLFIIISYKNIFFLAVFVIAILLHLTGVLIARWLFFAEAEHVVGLYYDR